MSKAGTVAIIGWGTAGVNAAIALRGAGYAGCIKAFSDTGILPYSPILTSYYVGGEKTYDECFPWSVEELDELDVEVVREGRVTELDVAAHLIRTEKGGEHAYDKCVVCVGARPMTVGFPKGCGYDPLVLRTMDDAVRMKEAFRNPSCKSVLVSGASMIALKCVEAALNCGLEVSLVGMNSHILDFSATPEAAARFERGLAKQGVRMRFEQTIARVDMMEDEERCRAGVTFSSGDVEMFDEIVVAHGVRSDFGFVKEGSLEIDRALVVDDSMRTSDPDVYAAGDAAQALELISGQKRVLGIWKTAALQGACAGRAIAAELAGHEPTSADAYPGAIMTNTIAVRGTLFISAGVSQVGEGQRAEVQEDDAMTVVRIFEPTADGGERLVGFNVASDVDEPGGVAYDTAAMLSLRIEEACRR
ncbi:MAG: FAD-dependent oxidoreductase [Eggerthellaceae bacterium]|nr:FAD-dependent oxidoreductase [Eggerthellaceae bacterium]